MQPEPASRPSPPVLMSPPRAFTQGVGTVFQVAGVMLFLAMSSVCCGSSLLSKDWATNDRLTTIGWHLAGDVPGKPTYSAQRAVTISVFAGVFFGLALATSGLGMQAQHRRAAAMAAVICGIGAAFWLVHALFAATAGRSTGFTLVCAGLTLAFALLLVLAIGAMIELRRDPPPANHEVLPADYKIPYSHYHDDPPEVRLAAEVSQRRERLAVQQKELEMLEKKLRDKMNEGSEKHP